MYVEIISKTFIALIVLFVLTRIIGKKQMSQLTYFNYITGITFGAITATMVINKDTKITEVLVSLITWSAFTIIFEFISLKTKKVRSLLDDEPTIVIKKGKIQRKALTSSRLNIDDLLMLLRNSNVFSIQDVEYAIFEANGKLSVMKKVEKQTISKKDMYIVSNPPMYLPSQIISDGKVIHRNLKEFNLSNEWLSKELEKLGITSVHEVFYAELEDDGKLHVDKYSNYIH